MGKSILALLKVFIIPVDTNICKKKKIYLKAFAATGTNSMKLSDPSLEYLTTQGGKTLTIYDIAEINEAYQCTGA